MKNLITIALLCLFTSAYSQVEINENAIEASLSFGKYTDCLRAGGICTFKKNTEEKNPNTQAVFTKDKTLIIYIKRDAITPVDEVKIAGQEINKNTAIEELTFLMEEELILNEEARKALQLPENLTTIATGSYPLIVSEKHFIIILKLI